MFKSLYFVLSIGYTAYFYYFCCPLIVQNNEIHYDIFMQMYDAHVFLLYFYFSKAIYKFILWK